ncbi:MAG: crotonase/enoyl-CoA hydratase family protein [Beijerinckiaceae bacterium]
MSCDVIFEKRDAIALLTLNRPDKLNALTYAMNDRLVALLDAIECDESIGAVVITGAGGRAFSAGADIREFAESVKLGENEAVHSFCRRGQTMTSRIEGFSKPVIAAINGIAFGGGCEITEAAHLAVASDRALFAKPEINIGILPTFGGNQRLPRHVGRKRALELLLTGNTFGPDRAYELGLINRVVPHERLISETFALAEQMLRHSRQAVSRILAAVALGSDTTIEKGLLVEREQFARICITNDAREGLDAWLGRRKTVYSGY